ncbi:rhomboid family intramembrane serine protease [Geomonas propionica]|uniref:Rhomboid family intramembrane serine protease n=1 Tax=Geomonas propionica TaxID=2798582 RepID=A0ABS0YQV3_9BACT|nr:rhomboid family intramembrane serine protease [Geomonas propionica]MBJ6800308.1 rhomboid family intramembrane serine protease [Geomonas propionica]
MSLSDYFQEHEEQAFVAKALATAVTITVIKGSFPGLISLLYLLLPLVFLVVLRFHAAASGVDATALLREHITFFPMMSTEDERRSEIKPWVTYSLILANVLIFYFFEMQVPYETISDNLIFLPHKPDLFNVPLSAFTSMFLHGSNGHLWGNMTFLWVIGSAVERRVGKKRFFWCYLATGLIGGLVFILVEFLFHGRAGHALGASGAIAGIMGIFAVRCYFKTMTFPIPILGIFSLILPVSLKVRLNSLVIMSLFFLSDLSGGLEQISGEGSMIGHWAHLGGMISGMLVAGYLKLGDDAVEERHLEIGIKASVAATGFQGGARSMQIALDRNPNNVDALLGMARIKTKFHSSPEGKALYENALELLLVERPAEVAEVLGEYLGKYHTPPSVPNLVTRLAEAMGKAGRTELQIPCLERVVEVLEVPAPQREKALYQLATLLEFTSCFEAARSRFAQFVFEYPHSVLAEKARERADGEVFRPRRPSPAQEVASAPLCPSCNTTMTIRRSTSGPKMGVPFWVCGAYPACRTFQPVASTDATEGTPRQRPAPPPERYRLVFDGTIGFTCDPKETKDSLVQLFRCGRDQVDRLCNGTPTVLKRDLDYAAALKYKEAICRTGALCTIEKEEVPVRYEAPPSVQAASAPAPSQPQASAAKAEAAAPFLCPKCGHAQEKHESCVACGVYFAKVAKLAEREFDDFRNNLESNSTGTMHRSRPQLLLKPVTWFAGKFPTRIAQFSAVASFFVLIFSCYFMVGFADDYLSDTKAHALQANSALKSCFDKGKPDAVQIRGLLAAHDFKNLEKLYEGYLDQYRKDVSYEIYLHEAYQLFSPEHGIAAEDFDVWVATTGSPVAYAARGTYKAEQGFLVRGTKYIDETPQSNLDQMQRLHDDATTDLQTALAANPLLMPAYSSLLRMAKTSNMSFSPKQIVDQAVNADKRAYAVRFEYIVSLEPRWGGSYGEMSDFATSATKYSNLNPRLWCLLGAVESDRADDLYRSGEFASAIRRYTKALKYGDRTSLLKYRAGCYFELYKKAEAIADYRKALYYDPTDEKAQVELAVANGS